MGKDWEEGDEFSKIRYGMVEEGAMSALFVGEAKQIR